MYFDILALATTLLLACGIDAVRAADMTTTTTATATASLCAQPAFLYQSVNGDQHCCAGSLDVDLDNGQAYCCIGNNNALATNRATSFETARTGTIATCSTTIPVTDKDYTSKVEAAGTKYAVSYVETSAVGVSRTSVFAVTPTSTGAAAAAKTPGLMAGEALLVFGAVALGL